MSDHLVGLPLYPKDIHNSLQTVRVYVSSCRVHLSIQQMPLSRLFSLENKPLVALDLYKLQVQKTHFRKETMLLAWLKRCLL